MGKRMTKAEMEIVQQREDRLDDVLFKCLEIMKLPEKWAMDGNGTMTVVYPHPIVAREAYRVDGIKYLPHKSYYLPDVLLDRLYYWEDLTKVNILTGKKDKPSKASRKTTKEGRKQYTKVTDEMKEAIVTLAEQGATVPEIMKAVGVSRTSVVKYSKQAKEAV